MSRSLDRALTKMQVSDSPVPTIIGPMLDQAKDLSALKSKQAHDTTQLMQLATVPEVLQSEGLPVGVPDGTTIDYVPTGFSYIAWRMVRRGSLWKMIGSTTPLGSGPGGSSANVTNTTAVAMGFGPTLAAPEHGGYHITFGALMQETGGPALNTLTVGVMNNGAPIAGMYQQVVVQTTWDAGEPFVKWPAPYDLSKNDVLTIWTQSGGVQYTAASGLLELQPAYFYAT